MIKRIGLALAVLAILALGTVAATAQGSTTLPEARGVTTTDAPKDSKFLDGEFDEKLSPDLVEEINAETDALVDYLRGRGFTVDVATYEIREPVFDESDEAVWEAIDDFYAAQFAAEVAGWSDEEKAEWNAEIDEFVAELAEKGIEVEIAEIAPGVFDIVWTEELEEALWDIEKDFYFEEEWDEELTPELIEEINAETEALLEYLQGLGYTVAVETDENGLLEPVFDESDEAVWEAIDDFYAAQFAAEVAGWSDEEKAEWNAEIDEFVAELAEKGIEVEIAEIAPGVFDIVWTEELEEALWDFEKDFEGDFDK